MLSLLQTSCACSLGFFIAKVLERDDCIYFIFAQLPVSYSFVQCSRHTTPSVIDLGRVTSNLLVTKSCALMLLFTLDLLASVNTVDYSLLLNTLSMISLSSFPPPSSLATSPISPPVPNCYILDFCVVFSLLPRTHLGTSALSSHSHPFLELSVASQAGDSLIHTPTATPYTCITDILGFNVSPRLNLP